MRWWIGIVALALGSGCGDDGGGSATSSTETSDTTNGTKSSTATTRSETSSSTAPATSSVSSSGVDESSSSDSTGGGGVVGLQNDQWESGLSAGFQMGFGQGECWASTFAPEAGQYPLTVDAAQMLVGGTDDGMEDFEVSVWSVDGENRPDQMMASGVVPISGVDAELDIVLFEPLFERPVFDAGNFAIAVCQNEHGGFPSIARDADGTITDDLNWLFTGGAWVQSSSLGLSGDWILRASVVVGG